MIYNHPARSLSAAFVLLTEQLRSILLNERMTPHSSCKNCLEESKHLSSIRQRGSSCFLKSCEM